MYPTNDIQAALNRAPIALLAGRGDLPAMLIDTFQNQKRPFVVLAFIGQTDPSLVQNHPHEWISFGEVGKASKYLKVNQIKEIVMAGALTRPKMSTIRPDWEGVKWLAKIIKRSLGDDKLLRAVIEMCEEEGYRVVGAADILKDLLPTEGPLTSLLPDAQALKDIARGKEVLKVLSPLDVGQAIIVQEEYVLGIEAAEGTDALIQRSHNLHRPGPGGVLVKMAKTDQERRVDLPAIGPETIKKAKEAGLKGIAIQASHTLLLKREETLRLAEENALFIYGFKE